MERNSEMVVLLAESAEDMRSSFLVRTGSGSDRCCQEGDLARSGSAWSQPVVCGFLNSCRKNFVTPAQVTKSICLLKLEAVKQGKA